ncbi:MAG: redoxin domain-containing protein, partial [Solirubrobacteraceae bacterium]
MLPAAPRDERRKPAQTIRAGPSAQPASPTIIHGAPNFALANLDGSPVSLRQFLGQRVLLTFFNPECGFCRSMVSDLAAYSSGASNGDPVTLVVSTGGAEANQELFGESPMLRSRVLLQREMEVASQYQVGGTPMGYLIGADGKIESELAVGAEALLRLSGDHAVAPKAYSNGPDDRWVPLKIHRGNRSLSDSRLQRDGLRAGTSAPTIHVPRLGGGEVTLQDYLGRRVFLVFSDPECGPCQALTPDLDRLEQENEDLSVVVISRGDPGKNLEKFANVSFP